MINFWPTLPKNNKNLASHIRETKKTPREVNLKDSAVNNRDLKEEMSFFYNKYTKNNSNCFVFSPKTKLRTIKRHFSPATLPYQLTTILTILPLRFIAPFSTGCSPSTNAEVVYTDVVGQKETILKKKKDIAEYNAKQAKTVEITTTDTGNYVTYPSIKAAVGANYTTISNYIKSKRTYLGKYNLSIKTTTRSMSTTTNTDNVPTLYKQKLTKVRVKTLDNSSNKRVSPAIKKHTPVNTLEWTNSVYMYNTKKFILLSAIDKIVIKLIKSYFNAYFLSNKIRKLSVLNKITISKLEVKHTNSKVVILVYVYSAKLINLQFIYENLSNNAKFSLVGLLGRFYNKKVELRVIRLRDMHLNASILAERLANELNKKFMSPLRALRRVLKTVRIPKLNLKLHS